MCVPSSLITKRHLIHPPRPMRPHDHQGNLQAPAASNRTPGAASMLKNTASSIAPIVTKLFNLSIQSGQIPTEWKQSLVVPIPKASNKSSPSNYRPISLLSVLSKVLERHIHMLITDHLTEHHMLSDNQWAGDFQQVKEPLLPCLPQRMSGLRC